MKFLMAAGALAVSALWAASVLAHCEIPCGIYDDKMRFDMMEEHITTVEKSMKKIEELSDEKDVNYNQIVRWVDNKETHATEIQHIASQYFLTQRIKPADKSDADAYAKYTAQLEMIHNIIVNAMKCKQSTDTKYVEQLRTATREFRAAYLGPEGEAHTH